MPFTDYAELQAAVADWIARPDLAIAIEDFIYLAETKMQHQLQMPHEAKATSGTNFVASQDWIPLPADCLEPRHLEIATETIRKVNIVSLDKLKDVKQNSDATYPIAACVHGMSGGTVQLLLAPTPGGTDPYVLYYWAGLTRLATTSTNWLLTNHGGLYLYGALVEALPYIGEHEKAGYWKAEYMGALRDAKKQLFRMRTGGGPLRVRPDIQATGGGFR
jgi:hypothetical protein